MVELLEKKTHIAVARLAPAIIDVTCREVAHHEYRPLQRGNENGNGVPVILAPNAELRKVMGVFNLVLDLY
jgi:hypothetical protein